MKQTRVTIPADVTFDDAGHITQINLHIDLKPTRISVPADVAFDEAGHLTKINLHIDPRKLLPADPDRAPSAEPHIDITIPPGLICKCPNRERACMAPVIKEDVTVEVSTEFAAESEWVGAKR